MSQKIAIAIIHGVGKNDPHFADDITQKLRRTFSRYLLRERIIPNPSSELVIEPIYWNPVLQTPEDILWNKINQGGMTSYRWLRRYMIDYGADAIAYQVTPNDQHIYDSIHGIFADTLKRLASNTGAGEKAPLCVIAHSLGSVIASNYIYDLQTNKIPNPVKNRMGNTFLDKGETLTLFYTLGSPIAIWSLRYPDFGVPVSIPSPALPNHYPNIVGEWVNYYSKNDVIGYPLKTLNNDYNRYVKEDKNVRVGGLFSWWNPACHLKYWTDNDVIKPIAQSLVKVWLTVNP